VAELPSGAVTFLFTDIEGSTRLVRDLRDGYADVLEDYQRIVRAVCERNEGREIDTQGDAFFVAFERARDAVTAAYETQRELLAHDWPHNAGLRARIGIHTGQAAVAGDRYLGLAVHRAARICAAGHGGQVLVSETTRSLLEAEEEDVADITLEDLGEQRLKDLERPVRLYQLAAPGLPSDFPPPRTGEAAFAGREEELAAAAEAAVRARPRRTRLLAAAALAALLVVGGVIALLALRDSDGAPSISRVALRSVGVIDPQSNELVDQIRVGNQPTRVALGGGSVWVANTGDETVSRIDAKSKQVTATIPAPSYNGTIAASGGSVWVASRIPAGARVSRIDPRVDRVAKTFTVSAGDLSVAPPNVPFIPAPVAAGAGSLWVGTAFSVSRSSAAGSAEAETIEVPNGPVIDLVYAEQDLWVVVGAEASGQGGAFVSELYRIDPADGFVSNTISLAAPPTAVAVGAGAVWVAGTNGVTRVEPETRTISRIIPLPAVNPTDIAVGEGAVWVANGGGTTVVRIDPETNETQTIQLGNRPAGIAAGEGAVWVTVY
jgi:YVTN family beta-propeller protein